MNKYILEVCKIGKGDLCCKYLLAGVKGFVCGKFNPADKAIVDKAWAKHKHIAQGDNCAGIADLKTAEVKPNAD